MNTTSRKTKKIIKLINNEKLGNKVMSAKACSTGAYDDCTFVDQAHCTTYAYDECGKDYAACFNGADDVCTKLDVSVCYGPGAEDNVTEPYPR